MSNGGNLTMRDKLPWWRFVLFGRRPHGLFRNGEKRVTGAETTTARDINGEVVVLSDDQAFQVTAVLAAVRAISQAIAQTPKEVVYREFDERRDRFKYSRRPDHMLWHVLTENPNDWQTPFEFYECMTIAAVLRGNAFAFINKASPLRWELIPLPSDSVTVVTLPNNTVVYEVNVEGEGVRRMTRDMILHLKGPQIGASVGADILSYAAGAVGLARKAEESHTTIVARRGRVDGIASSEMPVEDPEVAATIRKSFAESFGPGGRGGVAFLDQNIKFARFSDSASDMQLIEHRKFQIDEIGRAFGVYSQILNQTPDSQSYGSAEQVYQAHTQHTVKPWAQRWGEAIKKSVIGFTGQYGKLWLRFDLSDLRLAGVKDESDYYRTLHTIGALTPNEVRAKLGFNPLSEKGADRPMTQMNMRPGYEDVEPVVDAGSQAQPGAGAGTQVPGQRGTDPAGGQGGAVRE